jgi:hypothetical protein
MWFAWIAWLATLALCVLLAGVAGHKLKGTIWSLFIDSRNTWSLTQLQIGLWTLTIVPTLVAIVVARAKDDPSSAWSISVPGEVWALMAISLGSTTVATAIKQQKDRPEAEGGLAAGERIPTRDSPRKASFFDVLAYDEGKAGLKGLDVTKYQNLLLTLALVGTYLWNCLWLIGKAKSSADFVALPALNSTVVGILGLSHAGYLVGKAMPQNGTFESTDKNNVSLRSAPTANQSTATAPAVNPPVAAPSVPDPVVALDPVVTTPTPPPATPPSDPVG